MRISALQIGGYKSPYSIQKKNMKDSNAINYQSNITFGIANSGKLKTLFSYGLPCIYSGIEMIDPKKVQRLLKQKTFEKSSSIVITALEPFEKSLGDVEGKVYNIIKDQAKYYPDKTFKEILQTLAPIHQRRLRKKQAPIFEELIEASYDLPDGFRYRFKQFMQDTDNRLNDKPILIPFSSFEFKYKLEKLKDDFLRTSTDMKNVKVINKMIKEASRFSADTNYHTLDNQKKVLSFLEIILKKSILADNEILKTLFENSKSRLNQELTLVPFTRKSFIYDLNKILEKVSDKELKEKMLSIANKLPTSRESTSAYILKFASQSSEKIVYRILWPFLASVEHLYPQSRGGINAMSNFAGATARENSERANIDFVHQMKRRPNTKLFCQKYIDRLIEYFKTGIFNKENISPKYILDFKNTIKAQSKGAIVLDTRDLKL